MLETHNNEVHMQTIESGIPVPTKAGYAATLRAMKPGDSALFPRFFNFYQYSYIGKFTSRKDGDKLRVWRLE